MLLKSPSEHGMPKAYVKGVQTHHLPMKFADLSTFPTLARAAFELPRQK